MDFRQGFWRFKVTSGSADKTAPTFAIDKSTKEAAKDAKTFTNGEMHRYLGRQYRLRIHVIVFARCRIVGGVARTMERYCSICSWSRHLLAAFIDFLTSAELGLSEYFGKTIHLNLRCRIPVYRSPHDSPGDMIRLFCFLCRHSLQRTCKPW